MTARQKTINSALALAGGVASVAMLSASHSWAQYGTRGSVDGFNQQPIYQAGSFDLSQPPAYGSQPVFNGSVQNLAPVQPIQVLPVQNGAAVSTARGVPLNNYGGGQVSTQTISVQPVTSGPIVTSVVRSDGAVNTFTGQPLQGLPIGGFGDNLPLVAEDYATLDLDGQIRPGTVGRGLTPTGQGRQGTTEDPGIPGDNGTRRTSSQQVASTGSGSGSSSTRTTSSSSSSSSRLVGAIRSGVSVPRPQGKPANRGSRPATRPSSTTTRSTANTQVPSTAAPTSTIVRRAPRSELVAGDALITNSGALSRAPAAPAPAPTPTPAPVETAAAPADQPAAKPDPRLLKILFPAGSSALPDGSRDFLTLLANSMKADESVRIQLLSYASLPNQGSTDARRLSLSRALAVRSFLIAQGVNDQRILVRAEGDRNGGGEPDRMDIVRID